MSASVLTLILGFSPSVGDPTSRESQTVRVVPRAGPTRETTVRNGGTSPERATPPYGMAMFGLEPFGTEPLPWRPPASSSPRRSRRPRGAS